MLEVDRHMEEEVGVVEDIHMVEVGEEEEDIHMVEGEVGIRMVVEAEGAEGNKSLLIKNEMKHY